MKRERVTADEFYRRSKRCRDRESILWNLEVAAEMNHGDACVRMAHLCDDEEQKEYYLYKAYMLGHPIGCYEYNVHYVINRKDRRMFADKSLILQGRFEYAYKYGKEPERFYEYGVRGGGISVLREGAEDGCYKCYGELILYYEEERQLFKCMYWFHRLREVFPQITLEDVMEHPETFKRFFVWLCIGFITLKLPSEIVHMVSQYIE